MEQQPSAKMICWQLALVLSQVLLIESGQVAHYSRIPPPPRMTTARSAIRDRTTTRTRTRSTTKPSSLGSNCWTEWFDRDDPTSSGDWETLTDLRAENLCKICDIPLQIQAQTTTGIPALSTGDVFYAYDTVRGLICRNSDQKENAKCQDYMVRFLCPYSFCRWGFTPPWTSTTRPTHVTRPPNTRAHFTRASVPKKSFPKLPFTRIPITKPSQCWTKWFDRDDPSGTGDWETLSDLQVENPGMICITPLLIQVQTTAGVPMSATGDVIYQADTVTGFICKNSDQKNGKCQDYRVRFLCPLKFCVQSRCWTKWFDRDDPSGTGDWETLAALQNEYPEKICDSPLQIEVLTTTGLPVAATGNVIAVSDTTVGFICKNSDQIKGMCFDYKVRFLCPPKFCQKKDCYTEWFDRDDPSGTGDWETLRALRAENPGMICNSPLWIEVQTISGYSVAATGNIVSKADVTTGFICENSAQPSGMCQDFRVRFMCPQEFCCEKVCWTRWYDQDDPTGTGDLELLSELRKHFPNEICESPLYIDVVTVDTNTPVTNTNQAIHIYSPTEGFACRNQDQTGCQCRDYKVRFGCPCKYEVDTD